MNIPLNIDFQQILLHMMNFIILAAGLTFLLFKPVKKFMAQREQHYIDRENAVAEKEKAAAEAELEYKKRMDSTDEEIRAKRAGESDRLEKEAEMQIAEAKQKADKIIEDAKREAEVQRSRILKNTKQEIADLVVDAAERLMAQDHNPETDKALYDQFIADVGKDKGSDDEQ